MTKMSATNIEKVDHRAESIHPPFCPSTNLQFKPTPPKDCNQHLRTNFISTGYESPLIPIAAWFARIVIQNTFLTCSSDQGRRPSSAKRNGRSFENSVQEKVLSSRRQIDGTTVQRGNNHWWCASVSFFQVPGLTPPQATIAL
uniref:Uncharacterized protein n=1 Tax=Cyclophora tenuis TaxID=216820 RepID=A0A7S1GQV3_CYCTE|mmetsp:Transcript_7784/g.13431  ORF Transcript_7784/g.13431 Transcript_7784/m.13431 type:complete len:143 (+) Transcript_7784:361-789(+)